MQQSNAPRKNMLRLTPSLYKSYREPSCNKQLWWIAKAKILFCQKIPNVKEIDRSYNPNLMTHYWQHFNLKFTKQQETEDLTHEIWCKPGSTSDIFMLFTIYNLQ